MRRGRVGGVTGIGWTGRGSDDWQRKLAGDAATSSMALAPAVENSGGRSTGQQRARSKPDDGNISSPGRPVENLVPDVSGGEREQRLSGSRPPHRWSLCGAVGCRRRRDACKGPSTGRCKSLPRNFPLGPPRPPIGMLTARIAVYPLHQAQAYAATFYYLWRLNQHRIAQTSNPNFFYFSQPLAGEAFDVRIHLQKSSLKP